MNDAQSPPEAMLVMTTLADTDNARRIADTLVNEGLAACVSRVPGVESTYLWQGQCQHDTEQLLLIKTSAARYPALQQRLLALHPYELPEAIAVPIADGHPAYLDWIHTQCT